MTAEPPFLDFAQFRIDLGNGLLLRDGEVVALTPKAFDTLVALARRAGQVVSKEELLQAVWPDAFVTDATLTQNIYTLRKTLGSGPDGRDRIQTLPRRGYRFVAEVRAAGVARSDATAAEQPLPGAAVDEIRSIAVLPLNALGDGEDAVFLGLGLADAVIASLSHLQQLVVRATSSILRYVDETDRSPLQVARELEVDAVLEGTVQRLGDQLRVTVQLVSVARGGPCWAESFQGRYGDLFEAQDAIAHGVVAGLRLRLSQKEAARLTRRTTADPEACRTYARGRYFWNRRTAADLERAIELFRQAIELDPGYAQAHAGLADALILRAFYGSDPPAEGFRLARQAAARARELDGQLAEAHTSLAYTDFVYSRRWRTAEERFRRAIELNPHYPTAWHWYGFLLTALGRHDEAIDLATRAHGLEPLSLVIQTDLALSYYFARRYDEALGQLAVVEEADGDFGYRYFAQALTLAALDRYGESVEAARRGSNLLSDSTAMAACLGYASGLAGQPEAAHQALEALRDRPAQAAHRALIQMGLGERSEALGELSNALEERSRFMAFLAVWPAFDPLRSHPEFADLLRRLGLGER